MGNLVEKNARIHGSIFFNKFPSSPIAVIGPLTVDPAVESNE